MKGIRRLVRTDESGVTSIEYAAILGFLGLMVFPFMMAGANALWNGQGSAGTILSENSAPSNPTQPRTMGPGSGFIDGFIGVANSINSPNSRAFFNSSATLSRYTGAMSGFLTNSGYLFGSLDYSHNSGETVEQSIPNFLSIPTPMEAR